MARDNKFGTFGGVFTPSVLTILGVIMYLRLPWVVGNAGLYETFGIIAVAHVISIATGLSISSIATDKNVGAGGPYYIVSRSLGLAIGGTLGLALFVGFAFSISLYVIGFCESLLGAIGQEVTPANIRVAGTITIVLVTAITFISTAFAIKTQYLIMSLIVLSLFSIFLGAEGQPASEPHLNPAPEGPSTATLFGIFFPAVTGFTAGVNMSGDLRDPKRSIPRGTMAAIVVGMLIYFGLAGFLAYRVKPETLVGDPLVLQHIALYAPLVVMGIWGATLSSALGSILGAPRILQAVSADGITPRFFARGYGKSNEPRNALLLAFAIGQAGILIAELDAIARIVSMIFLTTYGFLNISCAIESWASPDFRPAFRIPKLVSVVGAVTTVVVMIQLDLLAMLGATLLMTGLFVYLKRRELRLESGDTWEGIWATLVRSGLHRLSQIAEQRRNWKPNVLLFRRPAESDALGELAANLVAQNGMLTAFELSASGNESNAVTSAEQPRLGTFRRTLPSSDPYQSVGSVCEFYGFATLKPNTVLLDWHEYSAEPSRFGELLDALKTRDFNVLLFAGDLEHGFGNRRRIDVWWSSEAGSLSFAVALVRFITSDSSWVDTAVRFVLLSPDNSENDSLRGNARRTLAEARLEAAVRVVNPTLTAGSLFELVAEESHHAALVVLGLPNEPGETGPDYQNRVDELLGKVGSTLLVRGNSAFVDPVLLGRKASISFIPPPDADQQVLELSELRVADSEALRRAVQDFIDVHEAALSLLHEGALTRCYARSIKLSRDVEALYEEHFAKPKLETLERVPDAGQRVTQRRAAFAGDCRKLLSEFAEQAVTEQRAWLGARLEALSAEDSFAIDADPLEVYRPEADFLPAPDDAPHVLRVKRRRRWLAILTRRPPSYRMPVAPLRAFYRHAALTGIVRASTRHFFTNSYQFAIELGKLLNLPDSSDPPSQQPDNDASTAPERGATLSRRLQLLVQRQKEQLSRTQWSMLVEARRLAQAFADDLARFDTHRLLKGRRLPKSAAVECRELAELPAEWARNQVELFERARLALDLSLFRDRLDGVAREAKSAIADELEKGIVGDCARLKGKLTELSSALEAWSPEEPLPRFDTSLDTTRFDVEAFVESLSRQTAELTADLPESVTTLSDESLHQLEEGSNSGGQRTELPVRRLAEFLLDSQLLGKLQKGLSKVPAAEQRAAGVLQDVVRLVTFHLSELETLDAAAPAQLREQLRPVLERSRIRVEQELEQLAPLVPALLLTIDQQLKVVVDGTNAYDLESSSASLAQHIRLHQGRKAVFGARSLMRRVSSDVRQTLVQILYRRTAGVVLTQKLKSASRERGRATAELGDLVAASSPRAEVLETVPFFYRQLFVGQSTVSETFWVGREAELDVARRVLRSHDRRGSLIVTGERGAGKSAFCQRVLEELEGRPKTYRLHPPAGGSTDVAVFQAALCRSLGAKGGMDDALKSVPDGSVFLLDDLELWWERSATGLSVVHAVQELLSRYGQHHLFLLAVNRRAYRLLDHTRRLSDMALAVLECGPLDAEELKTVISLRHGSTGLKFELAGHHEDDLTEFGLARLFSAHFDFSNGYPGAALRSWITHIDACSTNLTIKRPVPRAWERLDALPIERTALLVELGLHKQISLSRLARVTGLKLPALRRLVDPLVRLGLVHSTRQRVVELNPFVQHSVLERLSRRGYIP